MIRAHRVNATAREDASLVAGWNVAPNLPYTLRLLPGPASCAVLLYNDDNVLVASGAALSGTEQPCVLLPQTGQAIGMVDNDLGWHLLLTTMGTESQREIRINPAVDLPDEIHPVYGDDDLALARATAAIDEAAHYRDDVTVSCPLGLGAGLGGVVSAPKGGVVSAPMDGAAVIGQVESITWTATPDGHSEQIVNRRYVAIAPDAYVEPVPPVVADDTGIATHLTGTSGNVLANDTGSLIVAAVNGLSANVGVSVDGDNGGSFVINANGSWTFSPDGDFGLLEQYETANTSVQYYASDGELESLATLTVTVGYENTPPIAVDDAAGTDAITGIAGNVLVNDTDIDADSLTVSRVAGSTGNVGVAVAGSNGGLFTIGPDGAWSFTPNGEFGSLTGEQTATTSVAYHVSDGQSEDEGLLTITVSAWQAPPGISLVGTTSYKQAYSSATCVLSIPVETEPGDLVLVCTSINGTVDFNMTADSGFIELVDAYGNDNADANLGVFYTVMGDPVDSTVTVNGPSGFGISMVAWVGTFRGVDQSNPIDVATLTAVAANSVTVDSPQITPVTDGALVLSIGSPATYSTANGLLVDQTVVAPGGFDFIFHDQVNFDSVRASQIVVASWVWHSPFGTVNPPPWLSLGAGAGAGNASFAAASVVLRPATPISGESNDPDWDMTTVCINANGEDGTTNTIDAKGHTVSLVGSTQIDTSLGYPAIELNGTTDCISIADAEDLRHSNMDVTYEAWLYPESFATVGGVNRTIFGKGAGAGGISLRINTSGQLLYYIGSSLNYTVPGNLSLNTLQHVMFTHFYNSANPVISFWLNGVYLGGRASFSQLTSADPLVIGAVTQTAGFFQGKIAAFRATKGIRRFTAAFTPNSYPFPVG